MLFALSEKVNKETEHEEELREKKINGENEGSEEKGKGKKQKQ